MAQKRKVEVTTNNDDESDRVLYSVFRSAAGGLSHLYSQALNHHRVAFEAGQRHALEKLNEWMASKHQEGSVVTADDILVYLQAVCGFTAPPLAGWRHHFESTPQKRLQQLNELNSMSLPSNPLYGRQSEADLSLSSSFMQSQDQNAGAFGSRCSEMEIEESPH